MSSCIPRSEGLGVGNLSDGHGRTGGTGARSTLAAISVLRRHTQPPNDPADEKRGAILTYLDLGKNMPHKKHNWRCERETDCILLPSNARQTGLWCQSRCVFRKYWRAPIDLRSPSFFQNSYNTPMVCGSVTTSQSCTCNSYRHAARQCFFFGMYTSVKFLGSSQ